MSLLQDLQEIIGSLLPGRELNGACVFFVGHL
jgi:hypothetical protein